MLSVSIIKCLAIVGVGFGQAPKACRACTYRKLADEMVVGERKWPHPGGVEWLNDEVIGRFHPCRAEAENIFER